MSSSLQQSPYLRVQRHFPVNSSQELGIEVDKAYVDVALAVNTRTIGLFAESNQIITGEAWYVGGSNLKQQTLRQIYSFTAAGNIPHGINLSTISGFTRIYGTVYDGSVWYPLPYVNVSSATNQISVVVNATNIVISVGAGSPPSIVSGTVILEWLVQP